MHRYLNRTTPLLFCQQVCEWEVQGWLLGQNTRLVPPDPKNDLLLAKAELISKSISTSVIPYIRNRKKWLHNRWREEWKYVKQPYRHQRQWRRGRGCSRCRFLYNPWCMPWWGRLSQWSPRRTMAQQRSMQWPVHYQVQEHVGMSWRHLRSVESLLEQFPSRNWWLWRGPSVCYPSYLLDKWRLGEGGFRCVLNSHFPTVLNLK